MFVPTIRDVSVSPIEYGLNQERLTSPSDSLVTIAITTAVVFGIVLWDYLNLLPVEIKIYQSHSTGSWRTPAPWFFVLLRYSSILATLAPLFLTAIQTKSCQLALQLSQVGGVLVVASSGAIFGMRVVDLWYSSKFIIAVISCVYACMLVCWIAAATQYRTETGPPTAYASNCSLPSPPTWAPSLASGSALLFSSILLLLLLLKSPMNRTTFGALLLTTATTTSILIVQSLGTSFDSVKFAISPFAILIMATMGARVFLDLQQLDEPDVDRGPRPLGSMSSTMPFLSPFASPPTGSFKPATEPLQVRNPYTTSATTQVAPREPVSPQKKSNRKEKPKITNSEGLSSGWT